MITYSFATSFPLPYASYPHIKTLQIQAHVQREEVIRNTLVQCIVSGLFYCIHASWICSPLNSRVINLCIFCMHGYGRLPFFNRWRRESSQYRSCRCFLSNDYSYFNDRKKYQCQFNRSIIIIYYFFNKIVAIINNAQVSFLLYFYLDLLF